MIRSTRGSAMSSFRLVATGMLSRRASSSPVAHGLRSAIPRSVTVGSPMNISSKARPPLPAPTMTTLVMGGPPFYRAGLEGLRLASGQSLERCVLGNERDLHLARGSVALLSDDDVGHAISVLGLQTVALGPVEEQDDVGVLLEGARFPEVGELRLLALARLDGPGELRERDHRHVQLFGERLQRPRDLRDLLLAILGIPAAHK